MDAEEWDQRYADQELVWSAEPNQFVAAECADLPPGRAVDLAAGEGRNAIWLARRGWQVTAVDFSRVALDKGRRLAGGTEVDWVRADAITWHGEGFDLAVVAYLQLPEVERRAAARGAVEALRPGGTFLWVAHDSSNIEDGSGGPQDPAVLMTAADVVGDVEDLGVEVQRAERVARVVAPGGDHRMGDTGEIAWDCLVRAVRV
ncbi:class I SAM-dependent methyltransferase [Nocardioides sp.]|uniref:class I SAM-dependent methyltransferase n=1 Tax=Nocardioides sp. TaxID=35761 RepID=UPI002ED5ED4C